MEKEEMPAYAKVRHTPAGELLSMPDVLLHRLARELDSEIWAMVRARRWLRGIMRVKQSQQAEAQVDEL